MTSHYGTEGSGSECGPTGRPGNRLLILGLGNVLCGDDGLGVVAVERLLEQYEAPDGVEILDGGTLGLSLLSWTTDTETLLLVDAIRTDEPAGTLVRLVGDDVAPAVKHRLSVHQIGVADLLDGMRLIGRCPPTMHLLGIVPESLHLGTDRTPAIEQALPRLIEAIVQEAAALGHPLTLRDVARSGQVHHEETASADAVPRPASGAGTAVPPVPSRPSVGLW